MQLTWYSFVGFLVSTVVTVAISFYLKDYFQTRAEYSKMRKKLNAIAGKHATVLFAEPGGGFEKLQLYRIENIDGHGITLKNELHTVFVPSRRLLQADMILPCDNYEEARLNKMKRDMERMMDALMPAMFDRLFPALMNAIQDTMLDEFTSDTGEFSAVIGLKIQKVLSEEGFEIKRKLVSGSESE